MLSVGPERYIPTGGTSRCEGLVVDTGLEPALGDLTIFRSWGFGTFPHYAVNHFPHPEIIDE